LRIKKRNPFREGPAIYDEEGESKKFMNPGSVDVVSRSGTLLQLTCEGSTIAKEAFRLFKQMNILPEEVRGVAMQMEQLSSNLEEIAKKGSSKQPTGLLLSSFSICFWEFTKSFNNSFFYGKVFCSPFKRKGDRTVGTRRQTPKDFVDEDARPKEDGEANDTATPSFFGSSNDPSTCRN